MSESESESEPAYPILRARELLLLLRAFAQQHEQQQAI